MQDQTSFEVRFCAVKATSAYLLLHEKDTTILNHNKELLTPMLTVIMETIEKGDDDAGLKSLIDLAESCPKFLRPQLDQLVGACIGKKKCLRKIESVHAKYWQYTVL